MVYVLPKGFSVGTTHEKSFERGSVLLGQIPLPYGRKGRQQQSRKLRLEMKRHGSSGQELDLPAIETNLILAMVDGQQIRIGAFLDESETPGGGQAHRHRIQAVMPDEGLDDTVLVRRQDDTGG